MNWMGDKVGHKSKHKEWMGVSERMNDMLARIHGCSSEKDEKKTRDRHDDGKKGMDGWMDELE